MSGHGSKDASFSDSRDEAVNDENPPYMGYVKDYQTEGAAVRNDAGQFESVVLVKVNMDFLSS